MGAAHIDVKMLVIFFICLVIGLGTGEADDMTIFPGSTYVWKPYPREMYPHFRRAYLDLASSDSKIALFYHSLNLNITDGVYHPAEPDYTFTTDGYFDFYYNWDARPAEASVDTTTATEQSADESGGELFEYIVTDEPVGQSADESFHATVTDQSADESFHTTVTDQSEYDEQDFSNVIEDRLGLLFQELQELVSDAKSSQTETVEKAPEQLTETVEKVLIGSSSDEKPPLQAGSIRGIPGVHFPDYDEIPITSFSCADKKYIPGFYADLETGCQVFHVCWPHRRESFLCPVGTTFNQAILTCDYWYSTNCSLAPLFFDVNAHVPEAETSTAHTSSMIDDLIKGTRAEKPVTSHSIAPAPTTAKTVAQKSEQPSPDATALPDIDWARILKFLPVKSKVVIFPESTGSKVTIKHTSLKPHEQESEEVKLDSKVKFAARILEGIVKAAVDAQRSIPEIESAAGVLPPKEQQQAAKVPQIKPVVKQIPLPTIDKQFVVQPLPVTKTTEEEERLLAAPSAAKSSAARRIPSTPVQPGKVLKAKTSLKMKNENVPEIVMRALELAGSVLQRDILPYTRKVLVDSSVNVHKAKKL